MNNLICIFGKKVRSFKGNYLNLLFECQDIGINTFTNLSNFNSSSFNLRQSNNINFSANFFPKNFFDGQ